MAVLAVPAKSESEEQERTYANFVCVRSATLKKSKATPTVAIYHLSVKTISRSAGRSATAAAAYRSGVEITDLRTGEVHNYTRKGGVESADIVLPEGAPQWASNRSELWNAAELSETRKNSTVAREFEIALPSELSPDERKRLALDFAKEIVQRHGCAADVAIHAPGKEGDTRNHHAHILCSTRRLTPEGFGEKTRELDERKTGQVEHWRERFAGMQNERLREAGVDIRVDHRTLEAQGIDREPTRHLGPAATGYERRTKEPSNKRLDYEAEIAERLTQAKEAGELEKQLKTTNDSIIVLSVDIDAAKVERLRQQYGHIDDNSDMAAAIKGYGNWGLPPVAIEKPAPDWSAYKGTAGSAGSKPLPAAPKAAVDWSAHRSFAGTQATHMKESIHPGEEKAMEPSTGPGYFPETKEERQRNEEGVKGAQLLRESSKTDDLWARLEREKEEREEKNRERDSGPDFDR